MTNDQKMTLILEHAAKHGCPYDKIRLINRIADPNAMLSAGEARWLSEAGVYDPRIVPALEQATTPESRLLEFKELANRFDFSNKTLGKLLDLSSDYVSHILNGRYNVTVTTVAKLRIIVQAIEVILDKRE